MEEGGERGGGGGGGGGEGGGGGGGGRERGKEEDTGYVGFVYAEFVSAAFSRRPISLTKRRTGLFDDDSDGSRNKELHSPNNYKSRSIRSDFTWINCGTWIAPGSFRLQSASDALAFQIKADHVNELDSILIEIPI